jgi:hypothetical protein
MGANEKEGSRLLAENLAVESAASPHGPD